MCLLLLTLTCAILATCSLGGLFDKREMFVHFYKEEARFPVQRRNADSDEPTKLLQTVCSPQSSKCFKNDYFGTESGLLPCCGGTECRCVGVDEDNCKCESLSDQEQQRIQP
ncbi:hypothetical protein BsWGS_13277 [Bradybaena similaris]